MKERRDTRKRVEIISNICRPDGDKNEPHVGRWQDFGDTLMRMIYLPSVCLKPGQFIPSCPGCATPFTKESEHASMISYTANCLDLHDP